MNTGNMYKAINKVLGLRISETTNIGTLSVFVTASIPMIVALNTLEESIRL